MHDAVADRDQAVVAAMLAQKLDQVIDARRRGRGACPAPHSRAPSSRRPRPWRRSAAPCRALRSGRAAAARARRPRATNSENLMLDEPALRTQNRIGHRHHPTALPLLARRALRHQRRHRARGEPRNQRIRAAGQDDRHARAEHDAGGVGAGEEGQALGEHVAGFEVRHHQHVGAPRHRRVDFLDLRGLGTDRVVERERAVEQGAGDLAAVRHLAQRRRFDRRGHVGIDRFHRRQDRHPHLLHAQIVREVDRVLHDVDFVLQRRRDVHRGVGDDERIGVPRHVHDEAVADAPRGAQPRVAPDHRAHQLVGVQAAFHQRFRAPGAHLRHRLVGRLLAERRIDDRERGDVEPGFRGNFPDPRRGTDQDGRDQPGLGGIDRALQRTLVARMRDRGRRWRQRLAALDQRWYLRAFRSMIISRRHCEPMLRCACYRACALTAARRRPPAGLSFSTPRMRSSIAICSAVGFDILHALVGQHPLDQHEQALAIRGVGQQVRQRVDRLRPVRSAR